MGDTPRVEGPVFAEGRITTFTLRVLAGPHTVVQQVNAFSRTDGDLILYIAVGGPDNRGSVRYDAVALFPSGQWYGMIKVEGEEPRQLGFRPPSEPAPH